MRIPLLALVLAGAAAATGCSKMASLHTFVAADEAVMDGGLSGVWQDQDGEGFYVVKQAGGGYSITATDKSAVYKFEARLLASGDLRILDVTAAEAAPGQIPAHLPVRIWVGSNTVKMVFLDSDWVRQLAVQQLGALTVDGQTVITAPSAAVRAFLLKYGGDARAHGDTQVLVRVQ